MKFDAMTAVLYAAIIGVGIWVWRLVQGSENGTTSNGSTVTLTDPTTTDNGSATTQFGEWVDAWQDTRENTFGDAVIDGIQGWFR
jgi:hypothetical protein